MKSSVLRFCIITLSIISSFVSCNQQKSRWKGTFEEVDGVTIVRNPIKPIYNENVLDIEEDLSIGVTDGKKEYIFSQLISIDVDDEGRIYVGDGKESVVKVFDRNGTYITEFSKKGQGPGENSGYPICHVLNDNTLVIEDANNRRYSHYSPTGKFSRSISWKGKFIIESKFDSEGFIIARMRTYTENSKSEGIHRLKPDMTDVLTCESFPVPISEQNVMTPYSPRICWALFNNDFLVVGLTDKYEFNIYNTSGNLVRKIHKQYNPIEISNEYKNRLRNQVPAQKRLEIPQHYPPIYSLRTDDKGHLFVFTYEKWGEKQGYFFDVFDSEGKYIATIKMPIIPRVWKKGKIYTLGANEDGFHIVKRYKVTWKI